MRRFYWPALVFVALAMAACGDDGDSDTDPSPDECEGEGFDVECGPNPDPSPTQEPEGDPFEITWETYDERPCPDDSILTYDNFGQAFMLDWCVGCHSSALPAGERAGAPVGTDLDTIEGVRALDARIWARSADNNITMPPAGGTELEERFRLGEWLACGAP